MTPFSRLLTTLAPSGNEFGIAVSDDWLQGRTLYGGLSAALCVETAQRAVAGLPPLRSAQFSFVGPASGKLRIVPTLLRQGKSTAFVSVDLFGEAGLATRATLCFGAARKSVLAYRQLPMPQAGRPDDCGPFFVAQGGPTFAQHFDARIAGGKKIVSAADEPEFLLWIRHRDEALADSAVSMIALADAAPPSAMAMFTVSAPISSMTWMVDMLADVQPGDDGWRLMQSSTETIADGYSNQAMTVWDARGVPLMTGRQCVAIFV